jgi:ABC-type branched-subunit amino acid transport system permease subunit
LQLAAIAVLMGVRYVPAAALGGVFMALVPDVLTRFGHGTFRGHAYDISFDWFQIAVGVLLVIQLILLPDGVWGDLRSRAVHIATRVRFGARAVRKKEARLA